MRKIFILLSVVGIGAMGASFAACSSDDSTPATDNDSGIVADTYVPPVDSGAKKDSGPTCDPTLTCGAVFATGLAGASGTPCPTSLGLLVAVVDCACPTDPLTGAATAGMCAVLDAGGGDGGACADLCAAPTKTAPSGPCSDCAGLNCGAEVSACLADGVVDAGEDAD